MHTVAEREMPAWQWTKTRPPFSLMESVKSWGVKWCKLDKVAQTCYVIDYSSNNNAMVGMTVMSLLLVNQSTPPKSFTYLWNQMQSGALRVSPLDESPAQECTCTQTGFRNGLGSCARHWGWLWCPSSWVGWDQQSPLHNRGLGREALQLVAQTYYHHLH